jgi:hypothetical protein
MDKEFTANWNKVEDLVKQRFGENLDLQSILFVIGLQELGINKSNFEKVEKLDIIHIGVCTVLSKLGYYQFIGKDDEGWPHYKNIKKLPDKLQGENQKEGLKKAIINYFNL